MIAISISQTGLDSVIARMERLERVVRDPIAIAKDELVAWFQEIQRRQFATEGAAGASGHWPKLSERYARAKARRYPGAKILERTGRLLRSLTGRTGDMLLRVTFRRFEIGSTVPYAVYHQRGLGQKRRSPIDITNRDAAQALAIIRRRIFAEVRAGRTVAA